MCQGRAAAHQRIAPDRFSDPTAMAMLRVDDRVPVDQVRAGTPPRDAGARVEFEMVRACAEVMVPRTVAIDEAVRGRAAPQLVSIGRSPQAAFISGWVPIPVTMPSRAGVFLMHGPNELKVKACRTGVATVR